jgi:endogenous inhibitor of DNA gyrase (YacG/DUF329 family)
MAAWRFRRCPSCGTVHRAGELLTHWDCGETWSDGRVERECPTCGYRGPTWRFPIVREQHPRGRIA